jgi:type I restriction enzyme, S subunit
MAGEWEKVPLGELYDFSSGLSKPRSEFGFGHGFLSFKDVFYNYFMPQRLEQLVNSTEREQQTCSIKRGDVFLTRTSETMEELGMSCVALRDYDRATFNGFTKRLRPKSGTQIIPEYAGYYFRSPSFRREVTAMSSLSTRASLNNEMLSRLTMAVPPPETQVKIGSDLKALDDKIELNRRMNATLEAMARALFQSWFVDFDPVRAKLDGREPVGLDPATAALFPEHFEESVLGPIPQGWEVCSLANKIELLSGGTPKTSEPDYWDGDIPWYSVKDAPSETDIWVIQTEKQVTKLGVDNSATQVLPEGTTIISARGTVGRLALVGTQMAMNQSCYGVRGVNGYADFFTYFSLRQATADLQQRTHGTVFDTITRQTFESLDCIFPPAPLMQAFDRTVEPLLAQIRANLHQSRNLATLRDTLLPKLLSGELQVPEAIRLIEAQA